MSEVETLNNTRKADIDILVFNRVAKVGSQSLMMLMKRLGKLNGYISQRDINKGTEHVVMNYNQQEELIVNILFNDEPYAYSQHFAFVNFTEHEVQRPIYINLVRDPIERVISWHYYIRAEWYYKDLKAKLGDKAKPRPPDEFMNMDFETCVRTKNIHCQFNQNEKVNPVGDHRRQTLFFCGQDKNRCL